MAPCRDRNPTPIRFEERRIQGLFGLKTTLFLVLKYGRAGARFWGRAGRFQTLKQRRLFYAGYLSNKTKIIKIRTKFFISRVILKEKKGRPNFGNA